MSIRALLLAGILMPQGCALAHELWIERNGVLHTLVFGHELSAHAGEKALEYKPETVKQATCFNSAGQEIAADFGRGFPATLKGDCAASWFFTSSGYWSKTPYGTKNLAKNEAGAVIESWLSLEGVKRIDRWGAALERPLTRSLELTPQGNPLSLSVGDKLRLTVWHQGKPAVGVPVAYFGQPRGVSDNDGHINIRLRKPGPQHIQASLELPLNDARADKVMHASSLQFEIR